MAFYKFWNSLLKQLLSVRYISIEWLNLDSETSVESLERSKTNNIKNLRRNEKYTYNLNYS